MKELYYFYQAFFELQQACVELAQESAAADTNGGILTRDAALGGARVALEEARQIIESSKREATYPARMCRIE